MDGIGIFGYRLFEEIKNEIRNGDGNAKKDEDGNVNENYHNGKDNKITIKWNPFKQIKEYRRNGDFFRDFHIPTRFLVTAYVVAASVQ